MIGGSIMITVRVFRRGGGAQVRKKVSVHSGMTRLDKFTNSNGSADFEEFDRGNYTVYVDGGAPVYRGLIADVQVVYID